MTTARFDMFECQMEDCAAIYECLVPCDSCKEEAPSMGGQPMALLEEKTADASTEKHVPVIEEVEGGIKVTVGSTLHPMEDKHFIQWIEAYCADCDMVMRKFLKPGDEPSAVFPFPKGTKVTAREHCNVHGLWKA